jgi:hypothetical protein
VLIDPSTGLPEVPEGFFWKISYAYTPGAFRITLRKKLFGPFSQEVKFGIMYPPLTDDEIIETAEWVLGEWEDEKDRVAAEYESSKYIGTYPPKNLGEKP